MECSDGKINHDVDYWDMATWMRQDGSASCNQGRAGEARHSSVNR